jgi:pimeloyl-ACP methyl ester carboxylesterase
MRKPQAQSGRILPHPFRASTHLKARESCVARCARFSVMVTGLLLLVAVVAPTYGAEAAIQSPGKINYILIGFAGGFVRHDNTHHGPVLLAERIRHDDGAETYVQVFENRHRKDAFKTILRLLDRNHDGTLAPDEKSQAHVILFGHSWGAAAVVLLARELDRVDVPVLLTVQVDSVAKLWQQDEVIPDNVAAAANFYQPHGLIHGRSAIKAADQTKTQILGNYRFDYRQHPVQCKGASWFERTLMPSHVQSQCDPRLWNQVEQLMRERLEPPVGLAAVQGQ